MGEIKLNLCLARDSLTPPGDRGVWRGVVTTERASARILLC